MGVKRLISLLMNLILIRHAENEKSGDLGLTSVGAAFAQNLPITHKLDKIKDNIAVIYSSDSPRCVATVEPLAHSLEKEIREYSGSDMLKPKIDEVLRGVMAAPQAGLEDQWAVICCRSIDLEAYILTALKDGCAAGINPDDLDKLVAQQTSGYDMFVAVSGQDAEGKYAKVKAFHHTVPDVDDHAMKKSWDKVPDGLKKMPK